MHSVTDLLTSRGTPLAKQRFTWRELVGKPISKLDDDAFTRVRIILMNALETSALRAKQAASHVDANLRASLAELCRIEQYQATMVNWLLSPDHSPLEMSIAYEQACVELTAAVAQNEADEHQAQTYRFVVLDDLDHLYRFSALIDRLEGKDANNILQGYTDIVPGRPTRFQHYSPATAGRKPYDVNEADVATKIHVVLLKALESQTHDFYMTAGPMLADPVARELYAEIASVKGQHVMQYICLIDPKQTPLEHLLVQEAAEVYAYACCARQEPNPNIKALWERFLDYELGHFHVIREIFERHERRDASEVLFGNFPRTLDFRSQRDFVRDVLSKESDLRVALMDIVPSANEDQRSVEYRAYMSSQGVPTDIVAAGYRYTPGTELTLQSFAGTTR